MSPETLAAMLLLAVAGGVLVALILAFRAVKRWKVGALRVIGLIFYYLFCGMVSVEKPVAALVLALVPPVVFVVRRSRPEHVPGRQFEPAPASPAPVPEYRRSMTAEEIRGADVAAAWPGIATSLGLTSADVELTRRYGEMRQTHETNDEGVIAAMASLNAAHQMGKIAGDPGIVVRGNQVFRLSTCDLGGVSEHVTTLYVRMPHGMHLDDLDRAIPALRQAYRAYMVEFEQPDDALAAGVVIVRIVHTDPLAGLAALSEPLPFNGDWKRVPVGFKTSGEIATIKVDNCSGTLIGGLSGSGKTASIMSAVAGLALRPDVQFYVFDGKGGHDWGWLAPRANVFNRDDEDRAKVADQLEGLVQIMRDRLDQLPARRDGDFSLWAQGPSVDMPLLVVVIDECQTYFDKGEVARGDKESEAARQRCESAVATLVRKGRSAGVWVIPTTQKPTSDSLPSTIGANTASQIAFRVKTAQAEQAIFGEAPEPGEMSARNLPEASGYAVLASETGTRELVRFAYVPPNVLARIGRETAHLRHDPTEFEDDGLGPNFVKQIEG